MGDRHARLVHRCRVCGRPPGGRSCRCRDGEAASPAQLRAVHGRDDVPEFGHGVQSRAGGGERLWLVLPDDDDRRRHDPPGQGADPGRGHRRPAGHRHRPPSGRRGHRVRRASRFARRSGVAGREVPRSRSRLLQGAGRASSAPRSRPPSRRPSTRRQPGSTSSSPRPRFPAASLRCC